MWEKMLSEVIDPINIKIINLLMEDGRMSDQLIADRIGISKTAVRYRRLHLQKTGTIRIVATLVLQNINFSYADLFIKFRPDVTVEKRSEFVQECIGNENIYEITQYIGNYDLVLRILQENPFKLKEEIDRLLTRDELVADRMILPATRSNKAWGVEIPSVDSTNSDKD